MSFSRDVKEELSMHIPQARHCQIAETAAIIMYCGHVKITAKDHFSIRVQTENLYVARKLFTLLQKTFKIEAENVVRRSDNKRRIRTYVVILPDDQDTLRVLMAAKMLDENMNLIVNPTLKHSVIVQNDCCRRAFLRGAFLAAGSISDPHRFYHYEIVCATSWKAEQLADLICGFDIDAKVVKRKNHYVVYVKEGSHIVSLLGLMETNVSLLNLENIRILKEMRNSVNRQVNCEAANINKTVNAAVKQIDDIKTHFHVAGGNGIPLFNTIYDTSVFSIWKKEVQLELQDIYDRTKDKFIWNTLVNLKQGFNGWNDEKSFNEISGSLYAIRKNIDKYYVSEETIADKKTREEIIMSPKSPKIFISHSSSDKDYVCKLIELFESIGLNEKNIFCSSIPGYGIPLNQDIYDYLKLQFETHNLHVIFVLSQNYYNSVACMNEMGAAWILQNKYTTILLPGFEFMEIKGAINPRQIGLKLDNDLIDVKENLNQLKDCLLNEFQSPISSDIH